MTISQLRLGSSIGVAWSWWLGELFALVPARLRRWFGGMRGRQLLIVDASGGTLAYEIGGRREMLGRIGHTIDPARGRGRVLGYPQTVIQLPAEQGLRTQLSLPLAASGNLTQAVGFEIERQTPFKRDDVYFSHRVLARDAKARSIQVELSVAPRIAVDEALRLAAAHGLPVAGVEIAAPGAGLAPSPNLLPDRERPAGQTPYRIAASLLAASTITLAVAVVVIPLLKAEATTEDLARRVADAKRQAEATLKIQKEIDETTQDAQFLVSRKRQTPTVSELLNTLTRLLPDDTWLSELQITGSEVQMSGYSASATALLSLLDDAAGFGNAAFRSSVTQDAKLNREQFDIVAKLKPRSAK